MEAETRLKELSTFLTNKRASLSPEAVGLPLGGQRRRVIGLRREEVAMLAGVSTSWYTRFEQGKNIQLSVDTVRAIANVLQLTPEENNYLLSLAVHYQYEAVAPTQPATTHKHKDVHKVVQAISDYPVLVTDRYLNIVDWNDAATRLLIDFQQLKVTERNLIDVIFTKRAIRRLALNWTELATQFVAIFKGNYGKYTADPQYGIFIQVLEAKSETFKKMWHANTINRDPDLQLIFNLPGIGSVAYQLTSLETTDVGSEYRLSIFVPIVSES